MGAPGLRSGGRPLTEYTLVFYIPRTRTVHSIKFDFRNDLNRDTEFVFLCHILRDLKDSLLQTIAEYAACDHEEMDADEYVCLLTDELQFNQVVDGDDEVFQEGWKMPLRRPPYIFLGGAHKQPL
jgi:hypothetical protein